MSVEGWGFPGVQKPRTAAWFGTVQRTRVLETVARRPEMEAFPPILRVRMRAANYPNGNDRDRFAGWPCEKNDASSHPVALISLSERRHPAVNIAIVRTLG